MLLWLHNLDFAGGGAEEVVEVTPPTGGWDFLQAFDVFRDKRERDEEERDKIRELVEDIEDAETREIAQILQRDRITEAREQELQALEVLVSESFRHEDMSNARAHGVAKAFGRAAAQRNFSALEALERELDRIREEDEFLLLAMVILD